VNGLYWAFLVDSVPVSRAVVNGETSLGGSESACFGLARALVARGHHVSIYASKLAEDAVGFDAAGVQWCPIERLYADNRALEWDVVVALRMAHWFGPGLNARLRLLWNEDMLTPDYAPAVMAAAWAIDESVYVSEYHRAQWEDLQPELKAIGWVTKNGYDPTLIPANVTKDPNRIIHISRPERGLGPLLAMWPALKAQRPTATLALCRYASMYDGEGSATRQICEWFDQQVAEVNATVGGIEWLGSLSKPQLMQAIASSAVMWYPGVAYFAETSCIAAIEAQACGTPFVGSFKGALPETARPSDEAGLLIPGDAEHDAAYHAASVAAVVTLLDGCARQSVTYRELQHEGRAHVRAYTYDVLAAEWEAHVAQTFQQRYETHTLGVLRQLMHEEDRAAAQIVAGNLALQAKAHYDAPHRAILDEATEAYRRCDRIIHGLEHGPDDYARHAIQDPLQEVALSGRLRDVAEVFRAARATRVLDVACGNGAGAIAIAQADPTVHVVGIDYAAANIVSAQEAAVRAGVADRCTFHVGTVYDFERQQVCDLWDVFPAEVDENDCRDPRFDGLFVGEFLEHVAECTDLVDALEQYVINGATVVYTCPCGALRELTAPGDPEPCTHVHRFAHDDLDALFGAKQDYTVGYLSLGGSDRGSPLGQWLISYRSNASRPTGQRDLIGRIQRTRPKQILTLGMITLNAADDLRRCLSSAAAIVDEIIIGDTGSTDETKAIAARYGARILDLAPIAQQPEGFASARNAVLAAATGDWFCWIDADETLMGGPKLRRYLDGAVFNGYVIHQQHLYTDRAPTYDIPTRVFRRIPSIQFYGCVHEQPQMGDCNGDIMPALELDDVTLVHTGYLTERIRRGKALDRNLPLLKKDQAVFPDRRLGKVFVLRDYVNLANWECEVHGGLTPKAERGYAQAVRIFMEHFDSPADRFHAIVRPLYETALRQLGLGTEYEWAFAGKPGGLGDAKAKVTRLWMRDVAEMQRWIAYQLDMASQALISTPPKTDPQIVQELVA
jgi:glycosyltransferase involved in cell wall biosynthesis/2-polyprenyl-3-methyl-5-hydroxy-6-metoxy-1,4-benzoquinol methylase